MSILNLDAGSLAHISSESWAPEENNIRIRGTGKNVTWSNHSSIPGHEIISLKAYWTCRPFEERIRDTEYPVFPSSLFVEPHACKKSISRQSKGKIKCKFNHSGGIVKDWYPQGPKITWFGEKNSCCAFHVNPLGIQ